MPVTAEKNDMSGRAGRVFPLRPISFGETSVSIDRRDDGTIYLRPKIALGDYPVRITDRLHHWAQATPNNTFMAERVAGGDWRKLSYAELLDGSRHIASAVRSGQSRRWPKGWRRAGTT